MSLHASAKVSMATLHERSAMQGSLTAHKEAEQLLKSSGG